MNAQPDVAAIEAFAAELAERGYLSSRPTAFDSIQEFSCYCPEHEVPGESKKPSALWNPIAKSPAFTMGVWRCFKPGCPLPANGHKVAEKFRKVHGIKSGFSNLDPSKWTVVQVHGKAKPQPDVDDESMALYIEALAEDEDKLAWMLNERGLKAATLKKFEWGWHQGKECFIYPVYGLDGERHGMRLYDPFHLAPKGSQKARDKKRWFATEGRHNNQLYGTAQADESATGHARLIFEGETDNLFAHQDGFDYATTQTGGAGTWDPSWSEYYRDKVVYICYDGDDAGRAGREKVALALSRIAKAIYLVNMPDGMDYSEWRMAGHKPAEFKVLMKHAERYKINVDQDGLPKTGNPIDSVNDIRNVGNPKDIIETRAYVGGKTDTPFDLPKSGRVLCAQNKGKKCETCPLARFDVGQDMPFEFKPNQDDVLAEMMEADKPKGIKLIAKALDLNCSDIEVEEDEKWYCEIVSIQDPVDSMSSSSVDLAFLAFHYYSKESQQIRQSQEYILVGRRVADPRNRKLMFQVWHAERADTDLDLFQIDAKVKKHLELFRPRIPVINSIAKSLNDKYVDLSRNVTGIIGRRDLHLLYDLTLHSVLSFNFLGRPIDKGQLDVIVIGDTRTGKTAMVTAMNAHYRCGHLVSGENASYAGLIGGSAEMPGQSRRRMPEWGILPRHNRRAVAIDEAAGLSDIMKKMSSVRTSGIAEINKQGGGRVQAHVRLFWMTNPMPNDKGRSRAIKEVRGGAVQALMHLVGTQEDMARFDMAMATASEDVEAEQIVKKLERTSPKYTTDACHDMLLFAWTRKAEHIQFADGVEEYIGKMSIMMANKYSPEPPLVLGSNFHTKLARMTVALAVMTYSTLPDGETVVVQRGHVDYICKFVQRVYDDELFGYGGHSVKYNHRVTVAVDSSDYVHGYLNNEVEIPGMPPGADTRLALIGVGDYFDPRQFADRMGGMPVASNVINWLTARGMLGQDNRFIDQKPELHRILNRIGTAELLAEMAKTKAAKEADGGD